MRILALLILALIGPQGTAMAAVNVKDVSDIATFESQNNTSATNVNIEQYSSSDPTGGGQFVLGVGPAKTNCTSDHGVVLRDVDSSGNPQNCYYRQFSGPVHLSWYGVPDAASSGCYAMGFPSSCDATIKLYDAFAAAVGAGLGGDGGVTTDGRSIAILSHSPCNNCDANAGIEIPHDQYLTCAGPPGGTRAGSDYWTAPHSIVLKPPFLIQRDKNSRLSSCIVRPTWYYSGNPALNIPPANPLQTVQMVRNFTGTATLCAGAVCNMDHMLIVGFDTCDESKSSEKAVLSDLLEECLVNEYIHDNGGGMKVQNLMVEQYLERTLDAGAQLVQRPITNVQLSGADGVKVTIDTSATSNFSYLDPNGGDVVLINGLGSSFNSTAPVSANGRWLTASVSEESTPKYYDVVLTGASWAGPSDSTARWTAGAPVITVMDTTNIIPGQYICDHGTPPFCTPPTAFALSPVTTSDIHNLSGTGTGTVTVNSGTLAGWPLTGLVRVETEEMRYTLISATVIDITMRSVNGTSHAVHPNTAALTPAAPVVTGVIPSSEAVAVSAAAQNPGSGNVIFASDTRVVAGTGPGFSFGTLTLNPSYHTWTANPAAGTNPSGTLTVPAAGSGTSLTLTKNCFKVQPNQSIQDISNKNNISSGATVASVDCTTNIVHLNGTVTTAFSSDHILFSGCGYPGFGGPSPQAWLGNCASTSLLVGGNGDEAQGIACEYMHSFGNQIQIHMIDAPAQNCTNFVLAGGAANGDQLDPDSVALWLEGKATKTQFTNGRIAGAVNSILDTPTGQPDGIGISNVQIPGNVILGPGANVVLAGIHGDPTGTAFLYAPSTVASAQISGTLLNGWPVYFDDPALFSKMYCSGNSFATALCSQVKAAPTCSAGCTLSTNVTGNDGNFDVTTDGVSTTVSIVLGGSYSATPICGVSSSERVGGGTANAVVSSVNFQPYGTTVTFKMNSAVSHVYGACHGATG